MTDRDRRDDGSAPPEEPSDVAPVRLPATVAAGPATGMPTAVPAAVPHVEPGAGEPPKETAADLNAPTIALGSTVADRYRILRFVARGGMAEVYEAEDAELEERVALKFLTNPFAADTGSADRFRREVQLARNVRHPNVCRLFDLGRHHLPSGREVLFLSMEFLDGETLSERLRRDGPLPLPLALKVAAQIAAALTAAHAEGIVHRDLKPGNVMLVRGRDEGSLRAVVTDFGLARRFGEDRTQSGPSTPNPDSIAALTKGLTEAGMVLGTPAYMAPEQLQGKKATPRTDVYAFGLLLYEMVTGQRPFLSDGGFNSALSRLTDPVLPPRRLRRDLPQRWEATIMRCLQPRPEERFPEADEVVRALQPPQWKWMAIGAAAAIVLALAVTLLMRRAHQSGVVAANAAAPAQLAASPVQLTTDPGIETDPAFSPDGNVLAYAADRGGGFEIYLRQLAAGGSELQLTKDGQRNLQPTWSPDGAQIAYYSEGRHGIWALASLGGEARRLSDFGSRPAWSPDGKQIVFQSDTATPFSATAAMPPSTLWVVDATGGAPRPLTRADHPAGGHGAPSWSPDGTRIVFTASDRRQSRGWMLDLQSGAMRQLLPGGGNVFFPVFAPDGKSVLCSSTPPGTTGSMGDQSYALWQLPLPAAPGARAGEPRAIAMLGMASARRLAMPRAGGKVAYSALVTSSSVWTLPLAADGKPSGEPRALTEGSGRDSRPLFSPDGAAIVFERWRAGTQSDLWLMDAQGANLRQLTSDPAFDSQASWMPDGKTLLFLSGRGGGHGLWRVTLPDDRQEQVSSFAEPPDWIRVSPDGRAVAFHRRQGGATNVWVRDVQSGAERQVTHDADLIAFPIWTPDGKTLVCERKRASETQVVSVPLAGGEPAVLVDEPGQSWPYSISADGDRVAYAGFRGGVWNVWWVSRRSGERVQLTRFTDSNAYVRYPSLSPKGDQLVFERSRTSGDLWLLPSFP